MNAHIYGYSGLALTNRLKGYLFWLAKGQKDSFQKRTLLNLIQVKPHWSYQNILTSCGSSSCSLFYRSL